MRIILNFFLFATCLAACSAPAPETESTPALGARSAHAFTVMDPDGSVREHLLTGLAGPDPDLHPQAAEAARQALDSLTTGADLTLSAAGAPDRYGRAPVQARGPGGEDVAAALVETGWAMVWPRQGQDADFTTLYQAEARARSASAGAWADGVFRVFEPAPNALAQRLDSAVIVEGRIVSTGEGRGDRLYLNFGLDWRSDVTLSASREARTRFADAGVELRTLDGAVVRARGWVYAENGPMIALSHPAQLEIIDAPSGAALP